MRSMLRGRTRGELLGVVGLTLACVAVVMLLTFGEPRSRPAKGIFTQQGKASWYGEKFEGKTTASGERYAMDDMTAAHRKLPFGTLVEVTHLENGNAVEVEINDRGPYVDDRIIDLSKAAAEKLGMMEAGVAPVRIEVTKRVDEAIAN